MRFFVAAVCDRRINLIGFGEGWHQNPSDSGPSLLANFVCFAGKRLRKATVIDRRYRNKLRVAKHWVTLENRVHSGVLAQLVERLNGIEEVRGSNPLGSKASAWSRESNNKGVRRLDALAGA